MASQLAVWAPNATDVSVLLGTDTSPVAMRADPTRPGWWRYDEPYQGAYAFVIDGVTHPDPRSEDQPDGVDGFSHTVEHDRYRWSDQTWRGRPLASSVLYELHVGTFSPQGTYRGVIDHLDQLVELGVTAIELMPIHSFPGRWGWGYDGVAWFAPQRSYGSPDELKALIDACHQRAVAVVVDVVYNHLGPSGNHLWAFGPYFSDRHHTPWGLGLNVDGPDSDEVRRHVIDNALLWLRDYHVDGLRLDAVHAIADRSALHLLEELSEAVERLSLRLDRTMWLIAESEANDPRLVRAREAHGYGLDGQWSDDLHHGVHVALTGERQAYYADFTGLADVAKAWTGVFVRDGVYSPSQRRRHGRPLGPVGSRRFITALQNHDQIGNRAAGERIAMVAGLDGQRIGAVLTLLAPTVPLLFQGEEWAASSPFLYFTDHREPALADAIREGRRREFAEFGWRPEDVPDPQDPATFAASVLRWEERDHGEHAAMVSWYRRLLELRRRHPITAEDVEVLAVDDHRLVAWLGPLLVMVNLGPAEELIEAGGHDAGELTLHVRSGTVDRIASGVRLGPRAVAVFGPSHRGTTDDITDPLAR